ncbi:MAG TPA: hypothetical protein H9727_02045 [Candidatus Borkfalkia avistercoris]|uniref:Uncharacterized protein n=1 Tax=Candidatus Borkfalkia avistercoris TaxID=2838504 RepID=A0A9D2A7V1_9FIRM|nr:hypothetical protein [Candidatus Borkfalkia avistercoris]
MFKTKKKSLISLLLSTVFMFTIACSILMNPLYASASEYELTESDRLFIENVIFEMAPQAGTTCNELAYTYDDVYFSNEEWGGYVIEFTADEQEGYAIFFSINGTLKLIEINFNAFSPFYGKAGMKIYPALGYYYLKIDGSYYNASTMNLDNDYAKTQTPEFYASSAANASEVITRSITYNYGTRSTYEISNFYYQYSTELTGHSNNCCNVAGLILLNYWNKKFNNDILKLSSTDMDSAGNIKDSKGSEIMTIFYDYMNTNWFFNMGGTLPSNCYEGFQRYIEEHGYAISMSIGITYNDIMTKLTEGIPVFITATNYYFSSSPNTTSLPVPNSHPMPSSSTLNITYTHFTGISNIHTFIAYGYARYNLYTSDNQLMQEQLLKIANGWGGTCYFNYGISDKIDSAALNVFKPQ